MVFLSKKILNSTLFIAMTAGIFGCATKIYVEPTAGDLTVFKFEFPQGSKTITIYDQYRQCEGPTAVPFEKNETHKEIKVKRGEKISFTVETSIIQKMGPRRLKTACQNTFTLNAKAKEYEFKYVFEKGVCELKSVSVNGDTDQEANLIPRQHMQKSTASPSGPACK